LPPNKRYEVLQSRYPLSLLRMLALQNLFFYFVTSKKEIKKTPKKKKKRDQNQKKQKKTNQVVLGTKYSFTTKGLLVSFLLKTTTTFGK